MCFVFACVPAIGDRALVSWGVPREHQRPLAAAAPRGVTGSTTSGLHRHSCRLRARPSRVSPRPWRCHLGLRHGAGGCDAPRNRFSTLPHPAHQPVRRPLFRVRRVVGAAVPAYTRPILLGSRCARGGGGGGGVAPLPRLVGGVLVRDLPRPVSFFRSFFLCAGGWEERAGLRGFERLFVSSLFHRQPSAETSSTWGKYRHSLRCTTGLG